MKTIKMIATLAFFFLLGVGLVYADRLLVLRLGTECTMLASISITGVLLAMLRRAPEGHEDQGGFHLKQPDRPVSAGLPLSAPFRPITPREGSRTWI